MSTFQQLWNALQSRFPTTGFPVDEARNAVRGAWRQILGEHRWSFLKCEGFIFLPDEITIGTVTAIDVTRLILTLDVTANTALLASNTTDRPVIGRQFRYLIGPLYTIKAYNSGTRQVTLDKPFVDNIAPPFGSFRIYQVYYHPPKLPDGTIDFLRFKSVVSRIRNSPIIVAHSRPEIDLIDRQRAWYAPPQIMFPYITNSDGTPLYEMWPQPTAADTLICYYERRGEDIIQNSDTVPTPMTEYLIESLSFYRIYDWCIAHSSDPEYPYLKGVDWLSLKKLARNDYEDERIRINKLDMDMFPRVQEPYYRPRMSMMTLSFNGQFVQFPYYG